MRFKRNKSKIRNKNGWKPGALWQLMLLSTASDAPQKGEKASRSVTEVDRLKTLAEGKRARRRERNLGNAIG